MYLILKNNKAILCKAQLGRPTVNNAVVLSCKTEINKRHHKKKIIWQIGVKDSCN